MFNFNSGSHSIYLNRYRALPLILTSSISLAAVPVYALQQGEIEEMGDADQIYNNPETEYTKKLIEAIPEGKIEDIEKHHKKKLSIK